jgi:hypothetical protein
MSAILIPNWSGTQVAILGDVVDCTPADSRFAYTYGIVSAPGGSSATFSGPVITPDVAGQYVFSVTAGGDVLRLVLNVFATAVYSELATLNNPDQSRPRSDAQRRHILRGISPTLSVTALNAMNAAGHIPSGINLATYGG